LESVFPTEGFVSWNITILTVCCPIHMVRNLIPKWILSEVVIREAHFPPSYWTNTGNQPTWSLRENNVFCSWKLQL